MTLNQFIFSEKPSHRLSRHAAFWIVFASHLFLFTPPHPEYLSAHAVIAQACAEVMKEKFGSNYSFSDHTHDNLWGTRHYASFDACAAEAAWSRSLAGIHYVPTATTSLQIGKDVGTLVNRFRLNLNK